MVYDFKCSECELVEEVLFSTYAELEQEKKCKCGGIMKRIFSPAVSFNFKGTGTFKTGWDGFKTVKDKKE